MGFPRKEHWGGSPFPPPGNLPSPGIGPASPGLYEDFFPLGKPTPPCTIVMNPQGKCTWRDPLLTGVLRVAYMTLLVMGEWGLA